MSGAPRSLRESFPTLLESAWDVSPPPGWEPLVRRLLEQIEALPEAERAGLRIAQIKTKFACLAVHCHGHAPTVRALIVAAEEESLLTCETCGRPGHGVEIKGWYATLCDEHEVEESRRAL